MSKSISAQIAAVDREIEKVKEKKRLKEEKKRQKEALKRKREQLRKIRAGKTIGTTRRKPAKKAKKHSRKRR